MAFSAGGLLKQGFFNTVFGPGLSGIAWSGEKRGPFLGEGWRMESVSVVRNKMALLVAAGILCIDRSSCSLAHSLWRPARIKFPPRLDFEGMLS